MNCSYQIGTKYDGGDYGMGTILSDSTKLLSKNGLGHLMNLMTSICPLIIFNFAQVVQEISQKFRSKRRPHARTDVGEILDEFN